MKIKQLKEVINDLPDNLDILMDTDYGRYDIGEIRIRSDKYIISGQKTKEYALIIANKSIDWNDIQKEEEKQDENQP
jgi:hypothetical protein